MDDTTMTNEVAKDNRLGYFVPINSWTSNLKVANSSLICVFMFGGCGGLGFSSLWYSCVKFSLSLGSILIIYFEIY
jgi:hypothetical protein